MVLAMRVYMYIATYTIFIYTEYGVLCCSIQVSSYLLHILLTLQIMYIQKLWIHHFTMLPKIKEVCNVTAIGSRNSS